MRDTELMENALLKFEGEARTRFMELHRESGTNDMNVLSDKRLLEKIDTCKEQVIDLWFLLYAIEQDALHSP